MKEEKLSRGKVIIKNIHPIFKKGYKKTGGWIKNRNATRHSYSIFDTDY